MVPREHLVVECYPSEPVDELSRRMWAHVVIVPLFIREVFHGTIMLGHREVFVDTVPNCGFCALSVTVTTTWVIDQVNELFPPYFCVVGEPSLLIKRDGVPILAVTEVPDFQAWSLPGQSSGW